MISFIPEDLFHFLVIIVFSFLIGLEIKTYRSEDPKKHFGSARTYTFVGIMGFVFYKISIEVYIAGFAALTVLYGLHYFHKLSENRSSIISFLVLSLIYGFGALIKYSIYFPAALFASIIFILNYKNYAQNILKNLDEKEFETFSKFILLSAVVLPILPHEPIKYLGISPFKIWLIVVVISSISYGSYLAQKFIFKNKGYLLTGLLGGIYSSTATTVVLSKKALSINAKGDILSIINSSIIIATSMMYMRLLAISYIFNAEVGKILTLPLTVFAFIALIISFLLYKKNSIANSTINDRNPLELGTAFVFAAFFVVMMIITKYVTLNFGNIGLKILSFIVGFTDIDPFVLSLLTGKFDISANYISSAIIIASGSNNILKALYALIFSKKIATTSAVWLFVLGVLTIIYGTLWH